MTLRQCSNKTVVNFVCGVGVFLVISCASAGTKFDPTQVDSLTPGMTLAEVCERLGKPNGEVIRSDSTKIETWLYSHATAFGTSGARSVALLFDVDGRFIRMISKTQTDMH